jgi:hypothetical protein
MSDISQFYKLKNDVEKILSTINNLIHQLEINNNICQIRTPPASPYSSSSESSDSSDSSESTISSSEDDEIPSNIKYAINTIYSDLKYYSK